MDWQPIETAPLDSRSILAVGGLNEMMVISRREDSEWYVVGMGQYINRDQFTHWMPLPEPPSS